MYIYIYIYIYIYLYKYSPHEIDMSAISLMSNVIFDDSVNFLVYFNNLKLQIIVRMSKIKPISLGRRSQGHQELISFYIQFF